MIRKISIQSSLNEARARRVFEPGLFEPDRPRRGGFGLCFGWVPLGSPAKMSCDRDEKAFQAGVEYGFASE